MLTKIHFENFTAFKKLDIEFSPGINVFIGSNGTGKTHILKTAYAACDIVVSGRNFADKLEKVFFPSHHQLGRLAKRTNASITAKILISRLVNNQKFDLKLSFSNHTAGFEKAAISGAEKWKTYSAQSVFIPVKDMLANAPQFHGLYSQRYIHFEEIYDDILAKASVGALKGPTDKERKSLLKILQTAIDGKVITKKEEFFLKNKQGELEFTLLAEGFRKLALLWVLIQNGVLLNGTTLFWDEPEANLNPELMDTVVDILLALQHQGVQIFIATHNYEFIKWLSLKATPDDRILYHALSKDDKTSDIVCNSTAQFALISPNKLVESFGKMYDYELSKGL